MLPSRRYSQSRQPRLSHRVPERRAHQRRVRRIEAAIVSVARVPRPRLQSSCRSLDPFGSFGSFGFLSEPDLAYDGAAARVRIAGAM